MLETTCDKDVLIHLLWNHLLVTDEVVSRELEDLITILLLNRLLQGEIAELIEVGVINCLCDIFLESGPVLALDL